MEEPILSKDYDTRSKTNFSLLSFEPKDQLKETPKAELIMPQRRENASKNIFQVKKSVTSNKKLIYLSKQLIKLMKRLTISNGAKLTNILMEDLTSQGKVVEFKNIQRRVYDALHVLIALGYLMKINENIYYNDTFLNKYKEMKAKSSSSGKEILKLKNLVFQKKQILSEKMIQFFFLQKLIKRNKKLGKKEPTKKILFFAPLIIIRTQNLSEIISSRTSKEIEITISSYSPINFYNENHILFKIFNEKKKANIEESNQINKNVILEFLSSPCINKENKPMEEQNENSKISDENEQFILNIEKPPLINGGSSDLITDEKIGQLSQYSLNSIQMHSNCKKKIEFKAFKSNNSSQEIDLINFFN